MIKTPRFWQQPYHPLGIILGPLGLFYAFGTQLRLKLCKPYRVSIPVICVGNVTAGGTGKTPVVKSLVNLLKHEFGLTPHIIMRGYGGQASTTRRVDNTIHDANIVGDEALELADVAPVWVGRDRKALALAAIAAGATIIVMDDGLQNPALHKDISFIVVDRKIGLGNQRIIPAGPLREPLAAAIQRSDAFILIGDGTYTPPAALPYFAASMMAHADTLQNWRHQAIFAFAGIGRPEKLKETLINAGLIVLGFRAFPDHYKYSPRDIADLQQRADKAGAILVTTKKDWLRLSPALRKGIFYLDVNLAFVEPAAWQAFLHQRLTAFSQT